MKPRGDLQLAIGYWIVSHKQQLRTWWAILLMVWLGGTAVWTVIFFSIWFNQQPKLDGQLVTAAENVRRFAPPAQLTPQAVTVGPATIIRRDAQHIDLVAMLTNPNSDWGAATVRYRFVIDGAPLTPVTAFLNPDSQRPAIQLNQSKTATTASVEILETTWRRAASAELPTPTFVISDVQLTPTTVRIGTNSFLTVRLNANITNRSVYNFLKVSVPVVVKNGDTIVAVDEQTLDRWATLTGKSVTATWPFAIGQTTAAELMPQVSQFDASNLY